MTNRIALATEAASEQDLPPVHPGEVLKEEFLEPYGMSQYELAQRTGMPPQRVGQIVLGRRGISADTALRLGRFFDTSPEFWLNLQAHHDLEVAAKHHGEAIRRDVPVSAKELFATALGVRKRSERRGVKRQAPSKSSAAAPVKRGGKVRNAG